MPGPYPAVDASRLVSFHEALARLQGLIGCEVVVEMNQYGRFFGCALQGELRRILTLAPDHAAVHFEISGGQGILLDPGGAQVLVVEVGGDRQGIEFTLAGGVSVLISPAASAIT